MAGFQLRSPAFADGAAVPVRHTCDGEDLSPPLVWSGAPAGARSFALLCDDPDAPAGTWHHWALFDIPATTTRLDEGVPATETAGVMRQAVNDFGRFGYGGPCPPRGHGVHHYHFRLLALDVPSLGLAGRVRCREVERAARAHVLATAELVGTFRR
jgi:Raf kinase inhibitor-like YbhB/YbcL family protein